MTILETDRSLEIKGHAKTHVCAMVTALVVAFLSGVTEVLGLSLDYTLTNGELFIPDKTFFTLTKYDHDVKLLYEVLTKSLRQISIDYPESVTYIDMTGRSRQESPKTYME